MSAKPDFGFGKFVPGFDFLQNLATGGSQAMPQMPSLSNWVAPTINVEELDKRISELKAVQFWLDQNAKALAATIQALEVQKMTLATLQGMKVNMEEVAETLKARTADAMAGMHKMSQAATSAGKAEPQPEAVQGAAKADAGSGAASGNGAAAVDPLQWWGALTQQFQQIAVQALEGAAQNGAMAVARVDAAGKAAKAAKAATASGAASAVTARASAPVKAASATPAKAAARKAPARKSVARKRGSER